MNNQHCLASLTVECVLCQRSRYYVYYCIDHFLCPFHDWKILIMRLSPKLIWSSLLMIKKTNKHKAFFFPICTKRISKLYVCTVGQVSFIITVLTAKIERGGNKECEKNAERMHDILIKCLKMVNVIEQNGGIPFGCEANQNLCDYFDFWPEWCTFRLTLYLSRIQSEMGWILKWRKQKYWNISNILNFEPFRQTAEIICSETYAHFGMKLIFQNVII